MKKAEYYAKKYYIALFDDDAEEMSSALDELKKICAMDKNKEKEVSFEIEKLNSEFSQLEDEENAEEKAKNLIEKYRTEIEKASLIEDEIADKDAETKL